MTQLERAIRMRGIKSMDLARKLGLARQTINEYTSGRLNLGWRQLPVVAETLGVSQAYLRGIADRLPVYDWESGQVVACPIMAETDIDGYGCYYIVEHPDVGWMAVIMSVGIQFTPRDWQGAQPLTVDEIAGVKWVDRTGADAVMFDGLPRVMG